MQLGLRFTGRTPRSRQASYRGAQIAKVKAPSQADRLLQLYAQYGASSDSQMAERMGLPEARISARRAGLLERGLVQYVEDRPGRHGIAVTHWGLTSYGQIVAKELARAM